MRIRTTTALLLSVLFAAVLAAQSSSWIAGACERCGVIGYVDIARADWIAGWGFECVSGSPLDRVYVMYQKDDGFFTPIDWRKTSWHRYIHRPDVRSAYEAHCPGVTSYSGFNLHIQPGSVPSGTRVISVNISFGPYYENHRRTVTFP